MRTQPAVELSLSGHNDNAAFDCERRLQPLIKHEHDHGPHDDSEKPDRRDCYAIEGSWTIAPMPNAAPGPAHDPGDEQPGDMVIHYQGAMSRAAAHAAPPVVVDQRQVLRYGGARYRAISGFDPVPPI
jgi:hypothetical protein